MTDTFRALCAELVDAWLKGDDIVGAMNRARAALGEADEPVMPEGKNPTRDELWELWLRLNNELPDKPAAVAAFWEHAQINARARAALADEPAVPEVVGSEWQPCVKLPITVHVREQRPGEQHVSTREGITPVQSDDLIMLGVDGEEYPIGRELFQRTYRMGSADEPAVPHGREPAAVSGRPSDEELLATLDKATAAFPPRHPEAEGLNASEYLLALELRKARAVLGRWGNPAPTPADGEVAELVETLKGIAYWRRHGKPGEPAPTSFDIRQADRLDRAAELLQRPMADLSPIAYKLLTLAAELES